MQSGRVAFPVRTRHDAVVLSALFQDPTVPASVPAAAEQGNELLRHLAAIGWIDRTALVVIGVFFVVGLFKGLVWQVSRVVILIAAYAVAGRFGSDLALLLAKLPALGATAPDGTLQVPESTLYIAYVTAFVVVLVLLSLLAMLLQKAVRGAGLTFFDRLGGGVIGVATGGCVVLFGVFVVEMFWPGTKLAQAAETSQTLRLSKKTIDALGLVVPDDLRKVLELAPLRAAGDAAAGTPPKAVEPPQGPALPGTTTTPPRAPVEIHGSTPPPPTTPTTPPAPGTPQPR